MELGDFFGGIVDLGSAYISSKFAPPPQQSFLPTQSGLTQGFVPTPSSVAVASGLPVPPPPPGPSTDCGTAKPVYKMVCGNWKWVYPKRRRRRQLLTNSDANGLARLKGIVGTGKQMDTWIAKRG